MLLCAYNAPMTRLILYSTLGCHLCEMALDEIDIVISSRPYSIDEVDIADTPELMDRYGIQIPVLFNPVTEQALYWPFDRNDIYFFLFPERGEE